MSLSGDPDQLPHQNMTPIQEEADSLLHRVMDRFSHADKVEHVYGSRSGSTSPPASRRGEEPLTPMAWRSKYPDAPPADARDSSTWWGGQMASPTHAQSLRGMSSTPTHAQRHIGLPASEMPGEWFGMAHPGSTTPTTTTPTKFEDKKSSERGERKHGWIAWLTGRDRDTRINIHEDDRHGGNLQKTDERIQTPIFTSPTSSTTPTAITSGPITITGTDRRRAARIGDERRELETSSRPISTPITSDSNATYDAPDYPRSTSGNAANAVDVYPRDDLGANVPAGVIRRGFFTDEFDSRAHEAAHELKHHSGVADHYGMLDAASDAAANATRSAGGAAAAARDTISNAAIGVKDAVSNAAGAVGSGISSVGHGISHTATGIAHGVGDAARKVLGTTPMEDAAAEAKYRWDMTKHTASDVKEAAKDKAGDMADAVKDKATDAKEAAQGMAENLKDKAENVKDAIKDKAADVKDAIKDKAADVKEAVKETFGSKSAEKEEDERYQKYWDSGRSGIAAPKVQELYEKKSTSSATSTPTSMGGWTSENLAARHREAARLHEEASIKHREAQEQSEAVRRRTEAEAAARLSQLEKDLDARRRAADAEIEERLRVARKAAENDLLAARRAEEEAAAARKKAAEDDAAARRRAADEGARKRLEDLQRAAEAELAARKRAAEADALAMKRAGEEEAARRLAEAKAAADRDAAARLRALEDQAAQRKRAAEMEAQDRVRDRQLAFERDVQKKMDEARTSAARARVEAEASAARLHESADKIHRDADAIVREHVLATSPTGAENKPHGIIGHVIGASSPSGSAITSPSQAQNYTGYPFRYPARGEPRGEGAEPRGGRYRPDAWEAGRFETTSPSASTMLSTTPAPLTPTDSQRLRTLSATSHHLEGTSHDRYHHEGRSLWEATKDRAIHAAESVKSTITG